MEWLLGVHYEMWEHLVGKTTVFIEASWRCRTWKNRNVTVFKFKFAAHVFLVHIWQPTWESSSLCLHHIAQQATLEKRKKKKSALRQTDGRGCAGLGRVVLGWVRLGAGCARFPLPSVGAQSCAELRLAWVRQFQVPVIRSSQPNNLKLPTSHGSGRDPLNLLKADGVAETWENTSRVRHD